MGEIPGREEAPGVVAPQAFIEPSAVGEVLEYLARALVEHPDAVRVTAEERDGALRLKLKVDQSDMGKVIGKGGRVARSLRNVVRAAGTRAGVTALVEIVEE